MDAIRKKMQTMKFDIEQMEEKIVEMENITQETVGITTSVQKDNLETSKKVQKYEADLEMLVEKLQASEETMEENCEEFKQREEEVGAASRRTLLMDEELLVSEDKVATTCMKLAILSKETDKICQGRRHWESVMMKNDEELEGLDTQVKNSKKMVEAAETKYENLARSLAMMQEELKRASERVAHAEERVDVIEDELAGIGENQKVLEESEERARRREEKYQDQIKQIQMRLKQSDGRSEYAEMNISKLHLRIDELEDEIIREKLKINAVSGQLDDTFNEMLASKLN